MNYRISKVIAILLASFMMLNVGSVYAQKKSNSGTFFGKEAKGKWIIGVKAGQVNTNVEEIDKADTVGIVLGYEFDKPIGNLGGTSTVELEYLDADETDLFGVGIYDPDMLNLFFTYRSAGDLYYKLKLGLSYSDILIQSPGVNTFSEDVALAGGIGLGYRFGDYGVVEVEYSQDAGYNDLGIFSMNALMEF